MDVGGEGVYVGSRGRHCHCVGHNGHVVDGLDAGHALYALNALNSLHFDQTGVVNRRLPNGRSVIALSSTELRTERA